MNRVKWGIVSTADIGMKHVTPAIQKAANSEVTAIASREMTAATEAAATLGIPTAYGDYEALLSDPDVDAVYIPLPNDMHAEWTIRAAQAGKHVLCEKPLAMSAAQAREMADACDRAGVKLGEAFMYRHQPAWEEAVRLVRDGAIGKLIAVQTWFSFFNDDPTDIRNRLENGGGAVMDIGCYPINLSRMLFAAEPTKVTSSVVRDPVMGIDILTSAVLDFPGGGQSSFTCSIRAEEHQTVQIVGSQGHIEIEIPFNAPTDRETRIHVTGEGNPPIDPAPGVRTFAPMDQYTIQAERFAQSILDDSPVPVPIDDAIANMAVIEQVLAG